MSFLKSPIIAKAKTERHEPLAKPGPTNTSENSTEFKVVSEYWLKIESTTKRLEKLQSFTYLLIYLDAATKSDICSVLLLLSGYIRDPWDPLPSCLNCGEQLVKKAIQDAFSVKTEEIKSSVQQTGDIALSCERFKRRQPKQFVLSKPLTVSSVLEQFRRIADLYGAKSNEERGTIIRKLLLAGSALEDRYLVRLLVGKSRLGLQRKTMLAGLSDFLCFKKMELHFSVQEADIQARLASIWLKIAGHYVSNKTIDELDEDYSENSDISNMEDEAKENGDFYNMTSEEILKYALYSIPTQDSGNVRQYSYYLVSKAFAKVPSLTRIASSIDSLETIYITPFVPILPMLAKPATSYEDLLKEGQQFFTEYKYDGFRAQIHFSKGTLQIYSRSYENMSNRFPDVLDSVAQATKGAESFILDGEIVPISDSGEIYPFYMLSRRLKIYDPQQNSNLIVFFCFDIMLLNGIELLSLPFAARRRLLELNFGYTALFQLATQKYCSTTDEIEAFLAEAVSHKTEGLIVKTAHSKYAPDRRSRHWTKLKKDYLNSVGDTFDLVPVAGWYGRGKRVGVVGSYLLACRNGELFQTVTCAGTGMSDEFLLSQTWDKLSVCPKSIYISEQYSGAKAPDFWIDPLSSKVWEIKVANLSISKMHTCFCKNGDGIAARLPRLVRERDDKTPVTCSSAQFIHERFLAQPDRQGDDAPGEMAEMSSSSEKTDDSI